MIEESNGNNIMLNIKSTSASLVSSISNDDLSQSLSASEYTDADESMSAPTEFLAEFLSAVMLKDYKKALKYCKLILEFEPNNITAKEFYPLIQEKINVLAEKSSSDSDENDNNTSSPEMGEAEEVCDDNGAAGLAGGTDLSDNDGESDFSCGSDSDEKDLDASNSNTSNSTSGSENTTHSYSSSLLEEEDDDDDEEDDEAVQGSPKIYNGPELSDLNNGNYKSTSCSDSESPTEPLTQRFASILRCTINSSANCIAGKDSFV